MILDNDRRAWNEDKWIEKDSLIDKDYKSFYNDLITMDMVGSGNFDIFFTSASMFFNEAILEIKNSIILFDSGKMTGAYGSLKAASEILLMILFIFAEGNKEKQLERIQKWKIPENDFGKMMQNEEIKLWKNYSEVLNKFPKYKDSIEKCNNRMNKMRHKQSIWFFETASRFGWEEKWMLERKENSKEDISFVISQFFITWLIIDPILLIVGTEEFQNRYPDLMSQFVSIEFLGKYLPEVKRDNFIDEFELTEDSFEQIKNMFKYSEDQNALREFGIISNLLEISTEQRMYFTDEQLLIYDLSEMDMISPYSNIIIYGSYKFYSIQGAPLFSSWGTNMWTADNKEMGIFWDSEPYGKKETYKEMYDFKDIEFENSKILLFRANVKKSLEGESDVEN